MSVRIPPTGIRMRAVVRVICVRIHAHKMLTEIREQGLKTGWVLQHRRPKLCERVRWHFAQFEHFCIRSEPNSMFWVVLSCTALPRKPKPVTDLIESCENIPASRFDLKRPASAVQLRPSAFLFKSLQARIRQVAGRFPDCALLCTFACPTSTSKVA